METGGVEISIQYRSKARETEVRFGCAIQCLWKMRESEKKKKTKSGCCILGRQNPSFQYIWHSIYVQLWSQWWTIEFSVKKGTFWNIIIMGIFWRISLLKCSLCNYSVLFCDPISILYLVWNEPTALQRSYPAFSNREFPTRPRTTCTKVVTGVI